MPIRGNSLHLSNELITLNELKTLALGGGKKGGGGGGGAGRDEGDLGDAIPKTAKRSGLIYSPQFIFLISHEPSLHY